jgi:hypothetical protein
MSVKLGQRTFNFALKTTTENTAAVEALIASHAKFMKENHSLDATRIHLNHYYVSKANELNNPADPSQGETGNILYSINEVYIHAEGIEQHMGVAMNWPDIGNFLELLTTHGEVVISNGEVIHTL